MANETRCQLLIDPPAEGAWNMAVDEALLAAPREAEQPTLRFYQWERPTLSLGYFQAYEDRTQHPSSTTADVVRRLSGGGAILHDKELTYSLVLPASHPLAHDTQSLYDAVHSALVQVLQNLITDSPAWRVERCSTASAQENFLCFQRRFVGDILLRQDAHTQHKVVGSAQRRQRGVVLQHGSILLGQSQVATELPGIRELTNIDIHPETLLSCLMPEIAKSLFLDLSPGELSVELKNSAKQIQQEKYGDNSWTKRR